MGTWACPHGRFASLSHSLGLPQCPCPPFTHMASWLMFVPQKPNSRGRM